MSACFDNFLWGHALPGGSLQHTRTTALALLEVGLVGGSTMRLSGELGGSASRAMSSRSGLMRRGK
jgi:hypothetical protein